MSKRKLVTLQKVVSVEPIEGSDFIEKIRVLGWQLVAKKGEFKVGDYCAYFEIDSFLPIKPEFEFLRKSCYTKLSNGQEGFVLRTAKFRKVISQGLALPIEVIAGLLYNGIDCTFSFEEGEEITQRLGVVKYDPPVPECLLGKVKGYLPSSLNTEEVRVQTLQNFLNKYKGQQFYYTEKIDGESTSYYIDNDDVFHACSRSVSFDFDETNPIWKFAIDNDIETKLRTLPFKAALQGEIFGEGIRKNKYKIKGQEVRFFSIRNLESRDYLSYNDFLQIILNFKLNTVPILEVGYILTDNIDTLVELSQGKSFINPKIEREGIVLRPITEQFDAEFDLAHSRVSFKVINPNFLLKHGE